MMPDPTVSVIMNCLNGAAYLRQAIDSVVAQTYTDWELIFWDNASQDGSRAIAKSYGERIRYFRSNTTVPLGEARNLAIAKARGRYLAILDCDDVWLPNKLEQQVPLLERDHAVGLVFSDCYFLDSSGDFQETFFQRVRPAKGDVSLSLLTGPNYIPSPTVVMRSDAVRKAGAYNPALKYAESYDLFLRLSRSSCFAHVVEPLALYRIHGANQVGAGHAGMTREVMQVIYMAPIPNGSAACWAIRKRLFMLRVKLVVQEVRCGCLMKAVKAFGYSGARPCSSL